ncbi:MAG: hypothetical protein IPK66_03975 [Rhodospirillales bacterium]|nr:hypothetical protein [Rhodospirillales bacterium]
MLFVRAVRAKAILVMAAIRSWFLVCFLSTWRWLIMIRHARITGFVAWRRVMIATGMILAVALVRVRRSIVL